ncbi:MAG: methyltransferase family protein [Sphingobacteriales bacterium]
MKQRKDNPGVYPPPPLFYVVVFLISIFVQKYVPVNDAFLHTSIAIYIFYILIVAALFFLLPALLQFLKTKNTLVTIKAASSLQTSGIYAITRNPMYLGLLILYTGIAFKTGNTWTFIFIPILILLINQFVILNEEKYLERAFGNDYLSYKAKVRRWI